MARQPHLITEVSVGSKGQEHSYSDYVLIPITPSLIDELKGYWSDYLHLKASRPQLNELRVDDHSLLACWYGLVSDFEMEDLLTEEEIADLEDNCFTLTEARRTQIPSRLTVETEQGQVVISADGIQWRAMEVKSEMEIFSVPVPLSVLEEALSG